MDTSADRAIAIVGVGAILPDAPNAAAFWQNIVGKRYSISDVPAERWCIADYYDPDAKAPDKTYSKIGAWVRGFEFDWKRFHIPPRVAAAMDEGQQWAVTIAADALADYGYPDRPLDTERTAVILGTAMGGELHYLTAMRVMFPEYAHALESVAEFEDLPVDLRRAILERWQERVSATLPPVTEDSMPGELPNVVSGRVANVLNLRGPNFITDAACASSLAALDAALEMLTEHHVDAVLTGGVDRNMGPHTFVKFSKIGALSATGSRPFADGADGFVMGEGSGAFLLKRLEDAERNGDRIYAVIRGVGGASDGKGKGITAPNPVGQQLAIERAWQNAALDPATATLVEAHGTSTKVGDVVEVDSLSKVFGGAKRGSIALGSAKSNIGHLKAGAGAAGLLKATFALYHKVLPPTLNAQRPNPNIDFDHAPFYLNHDAQEWTKANGTPRRCGVSAYGFGGTNFHVVLEEHVPGLLTQRSKTYNGVSIKRDSPSAPAPLRGILALGANTPTALQAKLEEVLKRVQSGWLPPLAAPDPADLRAPERLVFDFGDHDELLDRLEKAHKVIGAGSPQTWKAFQAQGIFRGSGENPGKLAFLFPGQGSQYLNMGRELAAASPIVAQVIAEADAIMIPILGRPLSDYIYVDSTDPAALGEAELNLMQTAITQPAMLTMDVAIYRLLQSYGFNPDMVMGHSLGEYAALIVSGVMPFADALEAAAARGSEMSKVSMDDNGAMAAVLAPLDVVEATLKQIDGYVIPANINSHSQSVIGGASQAVAQAVRLFEEGGYKTMLLPVSHAFHTAIVAPASGPLRQVLDRLHISPPQIPLVANVTGDFYPTTVDAIKDTLQRQVASTVQWVKGLETLYDAGVRTFVEVGPKRALRGFVDDVFSAVPDVLSLLTNHPKTGDLPTFNQALCGLYAAGYPARSETETAPVPEIGSEVAQMNHAPSASNISVDSLSQMLAQALQQAMQQLTPATSVAAQRNERNDPPLGSIVISGTGLGLPGAEKSVMDPDNAQRILRGEQFVDLIPERFRKRMLDKRVTRLIKSEDGSGRFEMITDADEVIKLAGRPGYFDLSEEYGVPDKLIEALDITTQLAMAAGLDALREAGIPLVQTFRQTTTGKYLPDHRWVLPEALRDETGVIFASAFPGGDRFADEFTRYYKYQSLLDQHAVLEDLRQYTRDRATLRELDRRLSALRDQMEREPYVFDRRFLFRILAMGHSQFAEYVGARGPNTHVNAACASTTQALALAEDWIRAGRCRRVVVLGADEVTSEHLMEWIGAGFLATGAAAIDDRVEDAALPFDRRRHGTIVGMGACAMVVESEDTVRERGMRGLVEILSGETRNSAFHGTRLDVNHIALVMDDLITAAERRFGLHRQAMASQMVFMSHETFTPARGGSASAEVAALNHTFGEAAQDIVVANTKGFTGHPMGVGIEDVIAVKILEYGIVPPVPNFKEVDPELGHLNLSRGGRYPVQYSLHLAAGFGSQISLSLTRRIPGGLDRVDGKPQYQRWLDAVSGYDRAELEVEKRVLRVKATEAPDHAPAPNQWQYGTGPTVRTVAGGSAASESAAPAEAPSRLSAPAVSPAPVSMPKAVQAPGGNGYKNPVEPAPVPLPAPASEAVLEPAPQVDPIVERVRQIVAAQTGYPEDMLDLDLDLEADLGVDTVKQAETFTAIRTAFDIPRRDDLRLRDYPTLAHVVGFVRDSRPDLVSSATASPPAASSPAPAPVAEPAFVGAATGPDEITARVRQIVAAQTGYPEDMLDLDLDLEADLGVDTVKQAETFTAIRTAFDIPRRDDLRLRDYPTLAHVVGFVRDSRPDLVASATASPPAASSPAPTPVAEPAFVGAATGPDEITARVRQIVAAQTGYPEDMLDLDLDLEADLGVDTVKQAETFSAIRAAFDIPRRDDLKLRDYPTLAHVVGFVRDSRPDLVSSATASTPVAPVVTEPSGTPAEPIVPDASPDGGDPVVAKVRQIVAAQTGYPEDMLDLDLDLEADLGVDTVKQAETFSAIRAAFDIPRRDDLKLRDYPTLAHVVGFVRDSRPDLAQSGQAATPQAAPTESVSTDTEPANERPALHPLGTLEDANRIPRRVPIPALRPAQDYYQSTSVTLDENSRVVVMLDTGGVGTALVGGLQQHGVNVLALQASADAETLEAQLKDALHSGPIQGVYWLPALDVEPDLEALDLDTWHELGRQRVKNLYVTMRTLYDSVNQPGTFLVAATRLGGLHGYGPEGASAPLGGAVSGFAKAYKRERGAALVKVVDFEPARDPAGPADDLLAETLTDPGVVEISYFEGNRYTITLAEEPAPALDPAANPGLSLNQDTVFVVTGAAGGITSAITADLAAASGGIFYLLDLVRQPDANDQNVILFRQDKEALRRKLIDDAKADGKRPTPVQIDRQIMAIEREEAALRAVESVEAAGGTAYYYSVNLLDGAAVSAVVDDIRQRYGRIDVLVHAGGVEISRALPDKDPAQFNLVFDVKADGFFSLLSAARGMPIGATVAFSSVAGRFGNNGQTDYSAANDLLCKLTSSLRRWRPETRGIVVDWTAWGGIGMATRGSIPKIMEMAGIDMLPPESGIPTVRRELISGFRGEVVVGNRLGILVEEFAESGGLDAEKAAQWLAERQPAPLMVGRLNAFKLYGGLDAETTLDPNVQPFLYDHQLEGTPLLPGVMGTETFAEIANLLAPGYTVAAVTNVQFQAPFKFYRMESQTLHLSAAARPAQGGNLLARVALRSVREPAKPGLPMQEKVHFTADVLLTRAVPDEPTTRFTPPETLPISAPDIYHVYFHGPAYQVLEAAQVGDDGAMGLMSAALPDNTSPAGVESLMAPRLIELCFQTAGLWEIARKGVMALPLAIQSVTAYRQPDEADGKRLYAQVRAVDDGDHFDALVVDESGAVYVALTGYRTVKLPGSVSL